MAPNDPSSTSRRSGRSMLIPAVFALSLVLIWTQWRTFASTRDSDQTSLAQLASMQADATQILALRNVPQVAVGQTRTSQELLHQVEKALSQAGIDRSLWSDSVPQAAVRVPSTDYQRAGVRLYFGGVTLQQLTSFAHHLHADDPTLSVSAVNLVRKLAQVQPP